MKTRTVVAGAVAGLLAVGSAPAWAQDDSATMSRSAPDRSGFVPYDEFLAAREAAPPPSADEGPEHMHRTICWITHVDMAGTFACRSGHSHWRFAISSRGDTIGQLRKGQHVRVRWYGGQDGRTADDVTVLR